MRVATNETGRRVGETHHRSTIPDAMVRRVRDMREYDGLSVRMIAELTALSVNTVRKLVYYERRAQLPANWKELPDGG